MEKSSKLTAKKLIIIIAAVFVICACGLGLLVFARNNIKEVASTEDYGYVNPDETKAEADAGFTIDGVLDEEAYQNNNWLYLHNKEGGANVDIAMTSHYGDKGMYFVYDITEGTPIYVNTARASYLNSCIEMYLAPSSVTALNGNSIFEIDLLPTGDMTFKKSNGQGGYVNVATTDDKMAVLGTTTKGGEVNSEECYGYVLELFIPWDYMEKLGMDARAMKDSFVYVNPAHITSFNFAGTDKNVDRYWYFFAQQHGAAFSNVYQYFRFDEDGALGTTPSKFVAGEHCTITGDAAVIPGMKTTFMITPEAGYAVSSVLVNGEEYIQHVSYTEEGVALLTIRGKAEGLEIKATAEAVTDGNKTINGTIKVNGDNLSGVSASYTGPTGEKPIEIDGSGKFVLSGLKQGYYTINVEKEGYEKLTRGIYVNRDITTELTLEYPTFTVTGGTCWILDNQNQGILNKFGGTGYLMSTDSYNKFTVEANFRYDEELAKEYENDDRFTQQRQGYRIKFSNEKVWHLDVMKENGEYIVQYAKFSGDNSLFGWNVLHVMSEAEIAKYTSEDGIKLEVQRDGKYANVYLDDKLIAIEVLDDEITKCTAQIGFESWVCNREIMKIPYKITSKTDVDLTKGYFRTSKEWDLTNQYNGVIKLPASHDGDSGWLNFVEEYQNVDMTFTLRDYVGNETELRTVVKFIFENEQTAAISLAYADGEYKIQSMGDTLYGWRNHHSLTEEEIAKFQSKDGINLRIVRYGTEITLYLDGEQVAVCDLTVNKKKEDSGITASMPATVTIRHYGNVGHAVEIPFAVTETMDTVTITSAEGKNGKVVTEKQNYIIGDTVVLSGAGKEGYYCTGMKVNGKDVTLNWDGTYTFKATEKTYKVEGTFAERVFKDSKEWNLLKQNEGLISVPADHDGDSGYVDFYKQYKDIDLTLTTRDYIGNNTKLRTVVKFAFENEQTAMFSITYNDDEYKLQAMGDTLYGWGRHHKMTDEQIAAFQSEEGIDFRVVRIGTEVLLYLDDTLVKVCDLTVNKSGEATEITADMPATVSIRHYGNVGYAAETPFEVSDTVADVIDGQLTLENGGRVDTLIRNYAEDLDLTLLVKDYADAENKAARNDVLFVFENGAHVSFGITSDANGAWIQSLNNAANDDKQIYNRYKGWGNLTAEEFAQYKDGGVELRVVRIGTEVSLYINDRFVAVADLTNFDRGVEADTKAKVTVRHYDDAGLKVEVPFEWTETIELITVTSKACENGKVVTQKENYFLGDTVIITGKADSGYYCTGLKVNGEDVAMDMEGTYTFKATEEEYTVEGTFAKSIFKTNQLAYWNIMKQHEGVVIHRDDYTDKNSAPGLDFAKEYVNSDVSIIVKAYDDADDVVANNDRTGIGYWTSKHTIGFSVLNTNGKYTVGHAGTTTESNKWGSFYTLTDEETKMITEGDGIELRVIRVGTEAKIYLADKLIKTYPLPYEEDEATTVWIRRWDDKGVYAEIPFAISEEVADTVKFDIADCTNGTIATEYKNYFLNETVTIKVTPKDGYDCTSFKVDGNEVALTNGAYTFTASKMNYTVEAVFEQRVNITIADTANGTISTEESQYYVGDTVVLKVEGATGYYYDSLKVNDKEVMVDWDGTYSFKATETDYNVTGSFAEKIFKDKAEWDYKDWKVVNQNVGVLGLVGDGDSAGWVVTTADTYKDVTLTLRDYVENSTDYRAAVQFDFTNGKVFRVSLTNADTGDGNGDGVADTGVYKIQTMGSNTIAKNWASHYYLSDAEVAKLQSANGIQFRVALIGTNASIFLDGVKVCDIDLSAGIDADETARVYFRTYGNTGHDVEIPFVVSGEKIPVEVAIQDGIANGTITVDKSSYYAGDTVVVTVTGVDGYYYNSLKINGEEVMVNSDGDYTFKATELKYEITGSFAKSVFETLELASFDLMNQHKGIVYQKDTVTGNSPWLKFVGTRVNSDTSIIIKAGEDDFNEDGTLKDTNGDRTAIGFANSKTNAGYGILLQTDGTYHVAHSGTYNRYNSFYDFTEKETEKIKEEGIELRVIRSGAEVHVYLDGKFVKTCELPFEENEATTTFIRRWDDAGVRAAIGYKFAENLPETVTVDIANTTNGTITTDKTSYIIGEQVVVTVAGADGYYYDSLKVDGKEVMVDNDGNYIFKATKATHSVEGSFAASIFKTNNLKYWNLMNQHKGILVHRDDFTDKNSAPGQDLAKTYVNSDISIVVKANGDDFNADGTLKDANGDRTGIGYWTSKATVGFSILLGTNGKYTVAHAGTAGQAEGTWGAFYTLTEEETKMITEGEGIALRVVRVGTEAKVYLNGNLIRTQTLPYGENEATTVWLRRWDDKGVLAEIPFTISEPVQTTATFGARVMALFSDITSIFKED